MKGLGFREALEYLKAGGGGVPSNSNGRASRRVDHAPAAKPEPGMEWILDEVAARYTATWPAMPKRDLPRLPRAGQAAAPPPVPTRLLRRGSLPVPERGAEGRTRSSRLLKASGSEHFLGCITVPLLDAAEHVVGFYGRRIGAATAPAHLYLPGPHRGLVNRGAARAYPEAVLLTESIIDALSLVVMGFENAIPCYGVHGLTEEHAALLRDERVKLVLVGFDSDAAGRRGAGSSSRSSPAWAWRPPRSSRRRARTGTSTWWPAEAARR